MKRCVLAAILLLMVPAFIGCSGHSIREGIWELSFRAEDAKTSEQIEIPPRLVSIRVGPDRSGEGEIAEISSFPPKETDEARPSQSPAAKLRPMYADIRVRREGEKPAVQIESTDDYWQMYLYGYVTSKESIEGYRFGARSRRANTPMALQGWWSLHWVREE